MNINIHKNGHTYINRHVYTSIQPYRYVCIEKERNKNKQINNNKKRKRKEKEKRVISQNQILITIADRHDTKQVAKSTARLSNKGNAFAPLHASYANGQGAALRVRSCKEIQA